MSDVIPILVPHENVNDDSVTLLEWLVKENQEVVAGQVIAVVEGSKASLEVTTPVAGIVRNLRAVGEDIAVGSALCEVLSHSSASVEEKPNPTAALATTPVNISIPTPEVSHQTIAPPPFEEPFSAAGTPRFSKSAASLLESKNLTPERFMGRGLVTESDVRRELGEGVTVPTPIVEAVPSRPSPSFSANGFTALEAVPAKITPLSRSKRAEIKNLRAGFHSTLASVVSVAVPTRGLREMVAQSGRPSGGLTALIVFEVSRLLRKYPRFNACLADESSVREYSDVNIGIAIDSGKGLKVPVVVHADQKDAEAISSRMNDLLLAYLEDQLKPEDFAGGTFTVSDLSSEGAALFHPLISAGQSAILGVGTEQFLPGQPFGHFSLMLAFDHQIAEGLAAARFLNDLAARLRGHEAALKTHATVTAKFECSRCLRSFEEIRTMRGHLVQTLAGDGTVEPVCTRCLEGW